MRRLSHILQLSELHVYGLAVFFFLICCFLPILFPLFLFYLYKTKSFYNKPFLTLVLLLIGVRFILFNVLEEKEVNGYAYIMSKKETSSQDLYTVNYNFKKYHFYSSKNLSEGSIIYLDGKVEKYRKQSIPFGFDSYKYNLGNNVRGKLKIENIEIKTNSLFLLLPKEKLKNYVSNFASKKYLLALIFNETTFEQEEELVFKNLNLTVLLSISGIHLYYLFKLIDYILYFFNLKIRTQKIIKASFYLIFFYLQGLNYVLLRLSIKAVLNHFNLKYNNRFTTTEIFFLTFFIIITTQFHLIYNQGFLLSFLILLALNLSNESLKKYEPIQRSYLTSFIVFLVCFPFYSKVSIIVLLLMPIFIFIFAVLIFLPGIIVLIIPIFDNLYFSLLSQIELFITNINQLNNTLYFAKMSPYLIIVFYVFLIYFFNSKSITIKLKRFTILFLIVFLNQQYVHNINDVKITFLDVNQGDATIIEQRGSVVVIDAFANVSYYLRNHGYKTINYLVLTHKDLDHIKEAEYLINNFTVENLILNPYDEYNLKHHNIKKLKQGDFFYSNNQKYEILSPVYDSGNSNNNSLVIKTKLHETTFLFAGDIDDTIEANLINKYNNLLKADVLKLAHHGSLSSNSTTFLKKVNPTIAISSSGLNNRYNLPNEEIVNRVINLDIKLYRTDYYGSIIYKRKWKREYWHYMLSI